MREMKDSGIEWIKEIPQTWNVTRGKNILILKKRNPECFGPQDVVTCFRDGEVTLRRKRREEGFTFSDKEIGYQGIKKGDLVIHGMDGFAGAIGISDSDGKASPVLVVCDSKENKKYLLYYLRLLANQNVFIALATGIRERSCDLRWNKIADLLFPIPSINEQDKIANYLDEKCSKIDSIIEKQQAIIDKLKEYKLSIITEAVTKGLNPDVDMQDSGDLRIGIIPSDWNKVKITRILDYSKSYPIGDGDHGLIKTDDYLEDGIPYIRVQNLGWGTDLLLDNVVYISKENHNRIKGSELHPRDVIFCKTGATIGKTGMIPDSIPVANTTSHVGKITIDPKYNARFVFYYLSSYIGYEQFWDIACLKSTRPELSIEETKMIYIAIPSKRSEQDEIVNYLDNKCKKIDIQIINAQNKCTKLLEFKKSLIYEVVTGKKEV